MLTRTVGFTVTPSMTDEDIYDEVMNLIVKLREEELEPRRWRMSGVSLNRIARNNMVAPGKPFFQDEDADGGPFGILFGANFFLEKGSSQVSLEGERYDMTWW